MSKIFGHMRISISSSLMLGQMALVYGEKMYPGFDQVELEDLKT